jgi:hypothetical protein
MTNDEKIEHLKEHILEEALESMSQYGRYWNGSISRNMAPVLQQLIIDAGYDIHMREIQPHWDHVYYPYKDLVEKIANERAAIKEQCDDYQDLPV